MAKSITIQDVAREAGVSMMTVSRVVNNRGRVSQTTAQQIKEVIDRLGYRPSRIARSLVTNRTGTLGCIVPDVSNPFFSDLVKGVEQIAYAEGFNIFLCNSVEDPKREVAILNMLRENRVDGVILCSTRMDEDTLQEILVSHPSVVLVNHRLKKQGNTLTIKTVMLDDEMGGRMATQHLIDSGHRAIGFLMGPRASFSGQQRMKGYYAAMKEAGLKVNPGWTLHCHPSVDGSLMVSRELFAKHPELTAVYCFNDLVAVGALQAAASLGRSVPGDIAVVGTDDISLAALVTPSLSTVHASSYDLGLQAARLLIGQINGCDEGCDEVILPFKLVVRESAPARVSKDR
ncbi:MAG: LacI family DNA-binding transcriptional regulator [Anaerolineales bacterium]|jgi:LacI family transcriptional regulator